MKTPSDRPETTTTGIWITRGFDAFRRGTFGNAGQNLYVSRAGVLQRIHQHDIDGDGYVDLLFCNSQNHWESPPTYLYRFDGASFSRWEIPATGANCATLADLNGDGQPELIIGPWYEGIGFDINAVIYYGSAERGWGEHAVQYLPAPLSFSVAAGDFDGDGRVELAFQCRDHLRHFAQTDLGFEPRQFVDLPIKSSRIASADIDGDGCADIVARSYNGKTRIYWGGKGGIDPQRFTALNVPGEADDATAPAAAAADDDDAGGAPLNVEWVEDALPLPKMVKIDGVWHVFVPRADVAWLFPIDRRTAKAPVRIDCPQALSLAVADLDGDGRDDLVLACRDGDGDSAGAERSWIYWNGPAGFDREHRTALPSNRACELAIGRFDGENTCIAIVQRFKDVRFTVPIVIYRVHGRVVDRWRELEAHDAFAAFAVKARDHHDLLVINRQGRNKHGSVPATIYLGSSEGFSPTNRVQLEAWGSCCGLCADLNDDGRVDVVLANASENSVGLDPGSYVHLQGPDGFAKKPTQVLPTTRGHGVACADLDRDGYLDLVFSGFDQDEIRIFRGGPSGFDVANPTRIKLQIGDRTYKEQRFIYLADLNGDGWLDLVIPVIDCDHSLILWGGPEGFSMDRHQKLNAWHCCSCRAADLDGDGYLDLIMGGHLASATGPHDSFVYIYWNGPDGLREDRRTLLPSEAVNSISVADFNNDGNLDLFVGSYGDGRKRRDIDSYIYWNRGGRGFSSRDFTRLFTHSASGDFAADFNEDGWIDLAVANHKVYGDHQAHSAVWWNGPRGFDEHRTTLLPTEGPHGMMQPAHGNIMDRSEEEHYVSEPHELPRATRVMRIEVQAELGPKTWVRAHVRTADRAEDLTGAKWIHSDDLPSANLRGKWAQYRLTLGAKNCGSSPRVTEVKVHYE